MQPSDESEDRFARLSQFDRVDQICDAYEQALQAGEEDDLEAYVERACRDEDRSKLRAELLGVRDEYERRVRQSSETWDNGGSDGTIRSDQELRSHIGRYRIERLLGKGGFGIVYLALDQRLGRPVAVKVPYSTLLGGPEDTQMYLAEARAVANLDHPHIVPVYDVGSTDDCPCFIVSKYVEGTDLAAWSKGRRFVPAEAAAMVATLAEALDYAHRAGLVHRDVKPGNILIAQDGTPHLVDFGMALREEQLGLGPRFAGTVAYMSPEQARGEGHRVDGRSDIFSLGVVLYELLAGRRPFRGPMPEEFVDQIVYCEPEPLRAATPSVSAELERICFKALAKPASQRYQSARELAEELREFLANGASETGKGAGPEHGDPTLPANRTFSSSALPDRPPQVVSKGLRSFDEQDREFFLELLPGPKDRAGLPASLRFWKSRIEQTAADMTFPIGVIYGPSGCGKSSLVKAGLLPQLSSEIVAVYVEATPVELDSRVLQALQARCPAVRHQTDLREALSALRQGRGLPAGKKLLIVLDQFEQWLHAQPQSRYVSLADALRQCDGANVQCLLMIRDDFWLAVSRFLRMADERFVDGHNVALVDLFEVDHAVKVLGALGVACGRLPADPADWSRANRSFLRQAVDGLAEDGKVICVRLALFAEMMKTRPWTSSTLRQVGGAEGVGVAFLDETFGGAGASVAYRYHERAVRSILEALLPEPGIDLKGHRRSRAELCEVAGYAGGPGDFEDVMRILDEELRLLTPVDQGTETSTDSRSQQVDGGEGSAGRDGPSSQQFFQLTHDYLVPPLRLWLTRRQQETRRGRAELLLADRSALWNSRPLDRLLPSLREYVGILLLTNRRRWTAAQRRTMRRAGLVHGRRLAAICLALLALAFLGSQVRHSLRTRQAAARAESLVEGLLGADISETPRIVRQLADDREVADLRLREQFDAQAVGSPRRLRAAIALLPADERALPCVVQGITGCEVHEFPVLRDALTPHADRAAESLWEVACDEQQVAARRFQAAAALATLGPRDPRWSDVAPLAARHLTAAVPTLQFGHWLDQLQPAGSHLAPPLAAILADRGRTEKQRERAAIALAACHQDDPDRLAAATLLIDQPAEFVPLVEALARHRGHAAQHLRGVLGHPLPADSTDQDRDEHWRKQAIAAVALVHLGQADDVWPLLEFTPTPSLRSYLVFQLGKLRTDPLVLAKQLRRETDESVRRALLQALGGTDPSRLLPLERAQMVEHLQGLCASDPDPGVHSAASWTLRQWGIPLPEASRSELPRRPGRPGWHVNGQGQTFAVLPNVQPAGPSGPNYDFAVACHEVTVREFHRFRDDHVVYREMVPSDDCPVHRVTWYVAAEYCNWLSAQEGIPAEQWIYLPNGQQRFADGMRIKDDFLELTGYRLPTEAEWEYACRAGTTTSYHYGEPLALLERYAMYVLNAAGHSHPVESLLPSEFGLFDMHGNAWEWAHDVAPDTLTPVLDKDARILRGGSFSANPSLVLSSYRLDNKPDFEHIRFGFRVVRRMPSPDG